MNYRQARTAIESGTISRIYDNINKDITGAVHQAQDLALVASYFENLVPIEGDGFMVVRGGATADAEDNYLAFKDAYDAARVSTPYGQPLSATNRMTLMLMPGIYAQPNIFTDFEIDAEFVDIVGMGPRPESVRIVASANTLKTVNDVKISNLCIVSGNGVVCSGEFPSQVLHKVIIEVGSSSTEAFVRGGILPNVYTGGLFIDCGTNGSFLTDGSSTIQVLRCASSGDSCFGSQAGGLFMDCTATGSILGGGVYHRCVGGDNSFLTGSICYHCKGGIASFYEAAEAYYCYSGAVGFGTAQGAGPVVRVGCTTEGFDGTMNDNADSIFIDCVGTTSFNTGTEGLYFGCSTGHPFGGTEFTVEGNAVVINCTARDFVFSDFTGKMVNCVASGNFHFLYQTIIGGELHGCHGGIISGAFSLRTKFINCSLALGVSQVALSPSAEFINCDFTAGVVNPQFVIPDHIDARGPVLLKCTMRGFGSGVIVQGDTGGENAVVAQCVMGAGGLSLVNNQVTPGSEGNIIDAAFN